MSFGSEVSEEQMRILQERYRIAPKYIGTPETYEEAVRMMDWRDAEQGQTCLHRSCSQCRGGGVKGDGSACIHGISCPCPLCSFR